MTYEGTGPMIEMLKKMGTMKVTTRLTEISLDPIPTETFVVRLATRTRRYRIRASRDARRALWKGH